MVAGNRIRVDAIAKRLEIGRMSVYRLLEEGVIPGVRVGRSWLVTLPAFEEWEKTCGRKGNSSIISLDTKQHGDLVLKM